MNPIKEGEKGLKRQTISGIIWSFMERVLAQGVSFVVSIVLARLLMPEEYGLVAIVLVIINFCNVFLNSGISTALIQKKDADELDFSTAFWSSLVLAVLLYVFVFLIASPVALFYKQEQLKSVVRVMGLSLVVSSLKAVQKAYVSRQLQFRKFFWATLGGTIVAAIVGIWMAIAGFGVWALAAQYLTNAVIDTMVLGLSIEWKPKWIFSKDRLKVILSFGWKVLTASLIYTLYEDLRTLVIGKVYSADDLAFYNKGKQLPGFIVNNINSAISSALLPAMSKFQNNKEQMKKAMKSFNSVGAFVMLPMMAGMAIIAKPLVILLLTEKWLFCVPLLRLMCFYYALMPLQEANTQAVLAEGRSDVSLKAEIVKRGFNLLVIAATFWISVKAVAWGEIVSMIGTYLINTFVSRKLFDYGFKEQLKDIFPSIVMSTIMGICVWCAAYFLSVGLVLQIFIGILVYGVLGLIYKESPLKKVVGMLIQTNTPH